MKKAKKESRSIVCEEVIPIPSLNLPELKETRCRRNVETQALIFNCKPARRHMGGCLCCGSINYYVHGHKRNRLIHDVSVGLIHVDMLIDVPRYKCNDCGGTFMHPLTCIVEGTQFTLRLYEQIEERGLDGAFDALSKEYGTSQTTVAKIVANYCEQMERERKLIAPRVLGIDEKHIVRNARGVFVDVETSQFLELTADNKTETMWQTIAGMEGYENIQVVTMDMHKPYLSMVHEHLPNAKVVIDKYHVVQNLYKHVHESKKAIAEYLKVKVDELPESSEKDRKLELLTSLGKSKYLFKFGIKKLLQKPERVKLIAELCEAFPELNTLRYLKEGVDYIYASKTREEAEARHSEWKRNIPKKDPLFKEIADFSKTVDRWKPYIFNYFDEGCRYTNAVTEGFNSRIGHINNVGRGYTFKMLRYKVLFSNNAKDTPHNKLTKNDILI